MLRRSPAGSAPAAISPNRSLAALRAAAIESFGHVPSVVAVIDVETDLAAVRLLARAQPGALICDRTPGWQCAQHGVG
jgi:hypothetical protein